VVVEIYRAAIRGDLKVDVRFGKDMDIERGIDIDELETIREPPPAAPAAPAKRP
jgi:hypothetical protein